MFGYKNDRVTDIVSVIDGPNLLFGLSGRRSADTENVSDLLTGGGGGDEPSSVMDGGRGDGVFGLECTGESTSSSGDVHGEHLGDDSHCFGSCPIGAISSPL